MFLTLLLGAMTVGSLHALSPDHWVPFAAVARGRAWSAGRTARVTFLCGFGHVSVSALRGLLALFVGLEVMRSFGSSMGSVAGILLVAFGLAYGDAGGDGRPQVVAAADHRRRPRTGYRSRAGRVAGDARDRSVDGGRRNRGLDRVRRPGRRADQPDP